MAKAHGNVVSLWRIRWSVQEPFSPKCLPHCPTCPTCPASKAERGEVQLWDRGHFGEILSAPYLPLLPRLPHLPRFRLPSAGLGHALESFGAERSVVYHDTR